MQRWNLCGWLLAIGHRLLQGIRPARTWLLQHSRNLPRHCWLLVICYWLLQPASQAAAPIEISNFSKGSNQWSLTIQTTLTNHLDVYHVSRLNGSPWSLTATGLLVNGSTTLNTQTNDRRGYFVIGNGDLDSDHDALPDAREELIYQTDPADPDTDNDGMSDGWEANHGLAPKVASDGLSDLDDDGISNLAEFQLGSLPDSTDSDSDTLSDSWEYVYFASPIGAQASVDSDSDGWNNQQESTRGGRPFAQLQSDTNNLTQIRISTPFQARL